MAIEMAVKPTPKQHADEEDNGNAQQSGFWNDAKEKMPTAKMD